MPPPVPPNDDAGPSSQPSQLNITVVPPDRYLSNTGDAVIDFRRWIAGFDDYLFLLEMRQREGTELSDRVKNALLWQSLGSEGQRRFAVHPITDKSLHPDPKYVDYKQAALDTFHEPVSPIRARFDFQLRKQGSSETVAEYVTALQQLVVDCQFSNPKEMIATQLAIGLHDQLSQQKILTCDSISFDEFLKIAKAQESSAANAATFHDASSTVAGINKRRKFSKPKSKALPNKHSTTKAGNNCSNCGHPSHTTQDSSCPAKGQKCLSCGKTGHFAKVCRSKPPKPSHKQPVSQNTIVASDIPAIAGVAQVKKEANPPFSTTIGIKSEAGKLILVSAEIDTGAAVTVLPADFISKHFPSKSLQPAQHVLTNYDGSKITGIQGQLLVEMVSREHSAEVLAYVHAGGIAPLLGRDAVHSLQLCSVISAISSKVASAAPQLLKKFPKLTSDSLGTFPDFEHIVKIPDEVQPKAVKVRPIPLARRAAVTAEIESMVQQDILEPCSKSNWAHAMVTVPKPDGSVRITTDLIPLNADVIPDITMWY